MRYHSPVDHIAIPQGISPYGRNNDQFSTTNDNKLSIPSGEGRVVAVCASRVCRRTLWVKRHTLENRQQTVINSTPNAIHVSLSARSGFVTKAPHFDNKRQELFVPSLEPCNEKILKKWPEFVTKTPHFDNKRQQFQLWQRICNFIFES